ncbi:MAG: PAS domain S-box protein, partial [Patescibacteria group bacterium]|nr:PAS domain S-box protein [Patescibacteria group bacterium]
MPENARDSRHENAPAPASDSTGPSRAAARRFSPHGLIKRFASAIAPPPGAFRPSPRDGRSGTGGAPIAGQPGCRGGRGEYALVTLATVIAAVVAFVATDPCLVGLPYLLVIPLAWVVVRYSGRHVAWLFTMVLAVGAFGTVLGPAVFHRNATAMPSFLILALAYGVVLLLLSTIRRSRDETHERLALNMDELERFFASSLDLFCIANLKGAFLRLNGEWEPTLGYPLAELESMPFMSLVHPDDVEKSWDAFQQLTERGGPIHLTNRFRSQDGAYRCFEWRATRKDDRIYATARDITDRVQVEMQHRMAQFAMERALYSVVWVDDQARIVYANETFCASMGYARDELIGMPVFDIDPDFKRENWEEHKRLMREQGSLTFEGRHIRKDGSMFPVEVLTNYFEVDGKWHSCAFDRDISERKVMDETLRASERRAGL